MFTFPRTVSEGCGSAPGRPGIFTYPGRPGQRCYITILNYKFNSTDCVEKSIRDIWIYFHLHKKSKSYFKCT